jgi:hypothetical protein
MPHQKLSFLWPEPGAWVLGGNNGTGSMQFLVDVVVLSCLDYTELHLYMDCALVQKQVAGCSHDGVTVLTVDAPAVGHHSAELHLVQSNSWDPQTLATAEISFETVPFLNPAQHAFARETAQHMPPQRPTVVFSIASSNVMHLIYHVEAWKMFCTDDFDMTIVLHYAPREHKNGTWDQGTWYSPRLLQDICKEAGVKLIMVPLDVGCKGRNHELVLDWLWINVILPR